MIIQYINCNDAIGRIVGTELNNHKYWELKKIIGVGGLSGLQT